MKLGRILHALAPRSRRAREDTLPADFPAEVERTWRNVRPYTMTSPERLFALIQAVEYIVRNAIKGDFVECGVWRGGSMMAVAETLLRLRANDRRLFLFDTFAGMPAPSQHDEDWRGKSASPRFRRLNRNNSPGWAVAPLEEVKNNMRTTGYPEPLIEYVEGTVESSIPARAPDQIALLRLDTDWYQSTKHELVHLFPRVSPGGVLIVDDYGHWKGARKAVDEYIAEEAIQCLLCRIDYTGRIAVKH